MLDHVRRRGNAAIENVIAARLDHLGQVRGLDHFVRHQLENFLGAQADVARAGKHKRHGADVLGQLATLQRLAHLRHGALRIHQARIPAPPVDQLKGWDGMGWDWMNTDGMGVTLGGRGDARVRRADIEKGGRVALAKEALAYPAERVNHTRKSRKAPKSN